MYTAFSRRPASLVVREDVARYGPYESEGSERRALGAIGVGERARWTATLTVPMPEAEIVFIQLERQGDAPPGYRGGEENVHFSLPIGEADALLALLAGVIGQARRDGAL